jgi:hypothetical protein
VKTGRVIRQRYYSSPILFNLYSEYLTERTLEMFGDFKIEGQVKCTVKYADGLMLLVINEVELQGLIDKITEILRCCGM